MTESFLNIFNWLFNDPPSIFVWIGSTGGIIALILGILMLPTLLQMVWGKPNLKVEFEAELDGRGNKHLVCRIRNAPIQSAILSKLGMYTRVAEHVGAHINISRRQRAELVTSFAARILTEPGRASRIARLPASNHKATITVALGRSNGQTDILDGGPRVTSVAPGIYSMVMLLSTDEKIRSISKEFTSGTSPQDLYWL